MTDSYFKNSYLSHLVTFAVLISLIFPSFLTAQEDEETYSISLVQTAEVEKEVVTLGNKKVLTESYTAQKGDHIWKILRKKNLLKKNNLGEVLSTLKKLNKSLSNIDMIHPGEKIIIPLIITPIHDKDKPIDPEKTETIALEDAANLDYYTVKQGDSIIKVIMDKYSIPSKELYNEYLDKLRELNPDVKDLNRVYPGQKVRLPVYSPKVVRGSIEEPGDKPKIESTVPKEEILEKARQLGEIFELIGEEWIHQGKHFIPLKTGGQIDLNTETYPIINLRNGDRVIIDLFDNLPKKMSDLIRSSWDNYHIVHIPENSDLKKAVDKVLPACSYSRIYSKDENLVFEKGITIELAADWIIKLEEEPSNTEANMICLNLTEKDSGALPLSLDNFLKNYGVKFIDYPRNDQKKDEIPDKTNVVELEKDRNRAVEKLLELSGQKYSTREDIPIYQEDDSGFNLTVKADYYFTKGEVKHIIDLTGLGSEITNLLKEQRFRILSLPDKTDMLKLTDKTLKFLNVDFKNQKHTFYAIPGKRAENVKLIIPGILFKDTNNRTNFFTSTGLHSDISKYLSMNVDNIFYFNSSTKAE